MVSREIRVSGFLEGGRQKITKLSEQPLLGIELELNEKPHLSCCTRGSSFTMTNLEDIQAIQGIELNYSNQFEKGNISSTLPL